MSDANNGKFHKNVAELTRLAAAQIRVAVTESTEEVNALSMSFTNIVNQDKLIRENIQQLPDVPEVQNIKNHIEQLSSELRVNIDKAVMAFQFYDRLCQRLDHTSSCLKSLSEIEDHRLQSSANEVLELRNDVYNHFTMQEERQLFDAVLSSNDFEQAMEEYTAARKVSLATVTDEEGDIELF